MEKYLGKITKVRFGRGGLDDAMFGITVTMEGEGWGTTDFQGWWGLDVASNNRSREDWVRNHDIATLNIIRWMESVMASAKVTDFNSLKGIPVEVCFKAGTLEGWRVLTEVL
jgi:hypothetical protein